MDELEMPPAVYPFEKYKSLWKVNKNFIDIGTTGDSYLVDRNANDLEKHIVSWLAEAYYQGREAEKKEHVCKLPDSISEALNSGDGSYRP